MKNVNDRRDEAPRPEMLTINEVSQLLHIHPNTARKWSKIGVLKAYRDGKAGDFL